MTRGHRQACWLAGLAAAVTMSGVPGVGPVAQTSVTADGLDLVLSGGRVIDPESGLDALRNVGVRNGRIAVVSAEPLSGRITIDARGKVVAPGFIDLHLHGQDDENYRVVAMDGVTTALELEVGTEDVDGWYEAREGRALINHGVSAGHIRARMALFGDKGDLLPRDDARGTASEAQIAELARRLRHGLRRGALGVGMGLQYTPGATRWEVLEMFRVAAEFQAPVFVHVRGYGSTEPGGSVESVLEVIGAGAVTGAPVHVVHVNSIGLERTPEVLRMIQEARARGLDVTTEAYPYSAGMTAIESALLDQYENAPDEVYEKLQWVATGERLTRESFQRYRRQGGFVVMHLNTPAMEALAVKSPLTAIASDGKLQQGKGHPRTAGTSARVLGHYVRETGALTLVEAIRKLSLMPAQRLERLAAAFRNKGRIRVGGDGDLVVFDPGRVADRATYADPAAMSEGFEHVLVNGVPVVSAGVLRSGVFPGRGVRAASATQR